MPDPDRLVLARAWVRETDPEARTERERELVAALRGPRVARPWAMPDGRCVAVLREALAAWREAATPKQGGARAGAGRPTSGRSTVAVSLRLTPEAYARLQAVPDGDKGALVSRLLIEHALTTT